MTTTTTTTIHDILEELRSDARDNKEIGDRFERLVANYLVTDPQYADLLDQVWLWPEWPDRWGNDAGIDLVARERATGDYWAIQCKFYLPENQLSKKGIDSFLSESGKQFRTNEGTRSFTNCLIVTTTDKWSKEAEKTLKDQVVPVERLRVQDLENSPVDWSQFSLRRPQDMRLKPKKTLRDHQQSALDAVRVGFKERTDRGKLIMACGTGKTFTSLRIAETITPQNGRILFLAPSISLVGQTLREWKTEASRPFHAFAVCSDTRIDRDDGDLQTHDLAYPATTDAGKLTDHAQYHTELSPDQRTVVFATYQSIDVISAAQKQGLGDFDLIIADEAHRTTGITREGEDTSNFVKVHDNAVVQGDKRLYMTATPRIFADASKKKAQDKNAELYSMDDEARFGPVFYRLGFGQAVKRNLLTDYRVLLVAVDEDRMPALANAYQAEFDDKTPAKAIDTRFVSKVMGTWKGLAKKDVKMVGDEGEQDAPESDRTPMRRAVAFANSIRESQTLQANAPGLINLYRKKHPETTSLQCELRHVDGTQNALVRQQALEWLKAEDADDETCRMLTNARCLSEGIDVPALDAVVFFDTRESVVDIVQSVGRVMRKADNKQYGYIVLPVQIPSSKVSDYNSYVAGDARFKGIWKVIKALRAHDESLVDEAEFRKKIQVVGTGEGGGDTGGDDTSDPKQIEMLPELPIEDISESLYAAIPKKLGDREYWSDWAKDVARIAQNIIDRIDNLIQQEGPRQAFDDFLASLRKNINPGITETQAVEMLSQHMVTRPVFDALFPQRAMQDSNPVSHAMEQVVDHLDKYGINSETTELDRFYDSIRERAEYAQSEKSRQELIRSLYDSFFATAFKDAAEKLGIVYTPTEIVDFILHSANDVLADYFGRHLTDANVHLLDPFTGTGTFLTRLLQDPDLVADGDLDRKYRHEMHANEIVLLAYYVATVNIESAFRGRLDADNTEDDSTDAAFPGMVLTDTFQMSEPRDWVDETILANNSERIKRQQDTPIKVIVGNPPYSAKQGDTNYTYLDHRIRDTYATHSRSRNVNSLYDSYIRAIRWASDRIEDQGIVAFVTNAGWLDGDTSAGIRHCLREEFSAVYVFDLKGNRRLSGEAARKDGGQIFLPSSGGGGGSQASVAITLLIKSPQHAGPASIHYHDIGDYLSTKEKLDHIADTASYRNLDWQLIEPNAYYDWINQRGNEFQALKPLTEGEDAIFRIRSRGVETSRDAWVYNASRDRLMANVRRMIGCYNEQLAEHLSSVEAVRGGQQSRIAEAKRLVQKDPTQLKWTSSLFQYFVQGRQARFNENHIGMALYRPFAKSWIYYDPQFNHRFKARLFPDTNTKNLVIQVTGTGATKNFSALVSNMLPDLEVISKGQCLPLYWYERRGQSVAKNASSDIDGVNGNSEEHICHDGITDAALAEFRSNYADDSITKEDVFYYVYGVLHSPDYRTRYAADLKKELPRVPFASAFRDFSIAGRDLAYWHLNYDSIEPYPLTEQSDTLNLDPEEHYRVKKMHWGGKSSNQNKSEIVVNDHVILTGIPDEVHEYEVNGKTALDWILDQYQLTKDKKSGIVNDPNEFSDDPRYIVNLIKKVTRVSVETVRIVRNLPNLEAKTEETQESSETTASAD